ncbi:glycosyl transferase [Pseudonocardia sulfidoxydans NBRC 16205]|uniref:Glycosyl transferase n=1 Tax=Pseudonocardia sulfidoxydans NBRC 16205 TaxID=1223511 RepID=A0A511DQY1_9PSEU|nr:glycosyltransferase family 2 protein [Pseudonocardia sulfidoxydans]GEL25458.1 glycosyl transferase [Pseudonocardia sulfidoxydans NBRC 16205]
MNEGPKVDVVIPCYKYGHLLPEAVRSVLAQNDVDVRVLIIEDASDDGSADVARELAAQHERVEAQIHETNKGHIITFNEGILDWAQAPYTLLISADDELTPGALARATEVMDRNPNVGFVYGHSVRWVTGNPRPEVRTGRWKPVVHTSESWLRRVYSRGSNPVFSPSAVIRTELQKRVGGYDARMLQTSDLHMWLKLALYSDVAFVSGVDQAWFRVHGANMSQAYYDKDAGLPDLKMRKLAFDATLDHGRTVLGDTQANDLDERMRRALAREAMLRVERAEEKGWELGDAAQLLTDWAAEITGDVTTLPEWRTLRLRRWLGPLGQVVRPPVLSKAGRRIRQEGRTARLVRVGI